MDEIVHGIRTALQAAADPERAAGQQAYMKSAMPFLGVGVPETRRIARAAAKGEKDADGPPRRRTGTLGRGRVPRGALRRHGPARRAAGIR